MKILDYIVPVMAGIALFRYIYFDIKKMVKKNNSLWPDDLLDPVRLLKARLSTLETKIQSGDKLDLIDEFKKAIKLIENIK